MKRGFAIGLRCLGAVAIVWALYFLKANVYFRCYPVVMVALAFGVFASSLFRRPLVESFALRFEPNLDERGRIYCRKATWAWTIFLFVHLILTGATVFLSPRVWALYNGLIAYILLGSMFLAEYLVRRRVRRG